MNRTSKKKKNENGDGIPPPKRRKQGINSLSRGFTKLCEWLQVSLRITDKTLSFFFPAS